MTGIGVTPFGRLFPDQATRETRVLTVRGFPTLPDDEYGILEAYCDDPPCYCRRVMLNVVSRWRQSCVATISYGFDRDDELAGPFLDPLNPQSEHAEAILELVCDVLADPAYVARLQAHYFQVKGAAADPTFRPPAPVRPAPLSRRPVPPRRGPRGKRKRR